MIRNGDREGAAGSAVGGWTAQVDRRIHRLGVRDSAEARHADPGPGLERPAARIRGERGARDLHAACEIRAHRAIGVAVGHRDRSRSIGRGAGGTSHRQGRGRALHEQREGLARRPFLPVAHLHHDLVVAAIPAARRPGKEASGIHPHARGRMQQIEDQLVAVGIVGVDRVAQGLAHSRRPGRRREDLGRHVRREPRIDHLDRETLQCGHPAAIRHLEHDRMPADLLGLGSPAQRSSREARTEGARF